MSAILKLIIASAAMVLLAVPPAAAEEGSQPKISQASAQESCGGWGVPCEPSRLPQYCIAADTCATALPGGALVRYDALMDAAAARR